MRTDGEHAGIRIYSSAPKFASVCHLESLRCYARICKSVHNKPGAEIVLQKHWPGPVGSTAAFGAAQRVTKDCHTHGACTHDVQLLLLRVTRTAGVLPTVQERSHAFPAGTHPPHTPLRGLLQVVFAFRFTYRFTHDGYRRRFKPVITLSEVKTAEHCDGHG